MDINDRKKLILEHAQKTAALAAGNTGVRERLKEIEAELELDAVAIAQLALQEYSRDY